MDCKDNTIDDEKAQSQEVSLNPFSLGLQEDCQEDSRERETTFERCDLRLLM